MPEFPVYRTKEAVSIVLSYSIVMCLLQLRKTFTVRVLFNLIVFYLQKLVAPVPQEGEMTHLSEEAASASTSFFFSFSSCQEKIPSV